MNLEEEAEYCTENLLANKTASDYGIKDMSISEFSKLTNQLTGEVEKIYGLTPLQEGMLFYNLEDENSTSYVFQNVIKMESEADAAVMEESLRLLSERYDVLRTAIIYHGLSEPKQVVYRERKPELNIIEAKDEEENRRIIEKDVERGFVLDKDPLFRVTILKCNGKTRLLITTHHIITDGWCINLLFTKLISYYDRLKKNPETKSEIEKEIKAERATEGEYSDYIKWIDGKSTDGAREYWSSLLNGYDNVAEIKPIEKPEASKKQMDRKVVTISRQTTEKLIKYAEEHESTINTLSEAAIGIVLQGYTGSDDVVFGKVVSGRNAPIKSIDQIVGLFINTIPVRVTAEKDTTVTELIEAQQRQGTESTGYDYCSLAEIQSETYQGSNLIKVIFAFENYNSGLQGDEIKSSESEGIAFSLEERREQTNYPIALNAFVDDGELIFDAMYDPNEYCDGEIVQLLNRICLVIESMVEKPDQKVKAVSMLTEEEKTQILGEFNDTAAEYPRNKTVVDLFEEQVRKTPEHVAVAYRDKQLTYAELNARANQIAGKLREMGIRPNDNVALLMNRGLEMIVGIFAVLKAGAAYVPIHTMYPEERVRMILADCGAMVLLTDERREVF